MIATRHSCLSVGTHLVDLCPALAVLRADRGVVVQQRLRDDGVGVVDDGVVERSQALGVLVVGRGTQV